MITEERKKALEADYEFYMNKHLDKQCIHSEIIGYLGSNNEERDYLYGLDASFVVIKE